MIITNNNQKLFDQYFECAGDSISQTLIELIIEDRKYDIPLWFYKYITDDILLSIIHKYHSGLFSDMKDISYVDIDKNFRTFLDTCESEKVISSYAFVVISLLELKELKWAYFMNPKKVYSAIHSIIRELPMETDAEQIVDMIAEYIKIYKKPVPIGFIKLYMNKGFTLGTILSESISTISNLGCERRKSIRRENLNKLIDHVLNRVGSTQIILLFAPLWEKYNDLLSDSTDEIRTLVKYWNKGINYIPKNANMEILYAYAKDPSLPEDLSLRMPISPNYGIALKKNIKRYNPFVQLGCENGKKKSLLSNIVSFEDKYETELIHMFHAIHRFIIDMIKYDINNVTAMIPDMLEPNEKSLIIKQFKENPGLLKLYDAFFRCTKYKPNKHEFIEYLKCGGNFDSIKIINTQISPADYVEAIITYLPVETLQDVLLADRKVPKLAANLTVYEFMIREYVDAGEMKSPFIFNKIRDTIFTNKELIQRIKDSDKIHQKNRLSKLLSLNQSSIISLAKKYPYLVEECLYLYNNHFQVENMIHERYDIIYHVPWRVLTRDMIESEIELNGYMPIVTDKDENLMSFMAIVKYLGTDTVMRLIKRGKGFGYIIDYDNEEYLRVLIAAAIIYITDKNR